MKPSVEEGIAIIGAKRVWAIVETAKKLGVDFDNLDADAQERLVTDILHAELGKLHHLYSFMEEQGWVDRAQAKDDVWVRNRLNNYGCISRDDVKRKYNALATRLGHVDKMLR